MSQRNEASPARSCGIKSVTDKEIRVKINLDMTDDELKKLKEIGPAMRAIKTLSDKNVCLRINSDMSAAELERLKEVGPTLRATPVACPTPRTSRSRRSAGPRRPACAGDRVAARDPVLVGECAGRYRRRGLPHRPPRRVQIRQVWAVWPGRRPGGAADRVAIGGAVARRRAGRRPGGTIGKIGPATPLLRCSTAVVGMQGIMDSFKASNVTDSAADDAEVEESGRGRQRSRSSPAERSLASAKAAQSAQEDDLRAEGSHRAAEGLPRFANADAGLVGERSRPRAGDAQQDLKLSRRPPTSVGWTRCWRCRSAGASLAEA